MISKFMKVVVVNSAGVYRGDPIPLFICFIHHRAKCGKVVVLKNKGKIPAEHLDKFSLLVLS